jgi:Spy/CpxP family protein refolding chaperone
MERVHLVAITCLVFAAPAGRAQHERHRATPAEEPGPTAGSDIAALDSAEVAALLEGQGMGLARAAEMNGYPGPLHVIELQDRLDLTPAQRSTTDSLRAQVLLEARALGALIVEREVELDRLFADGNATPAAVDTVTADVANLLGRLRAVHLRAHIAMRAALTSEQVATYDRLRRDPNR